MTELLGRPQLVPGEGYYYLKEYHCLYRFIGYTRDGRYVFEYPNNRSTTAVTTIKNYENINQKAFIDNLTAEKDLLVYDEWYSVLIINGLLRLSFTGPKTLEQEENKKYIPRLGFVRVKCRGGQFLNVMNGGSMIQHIDGHHEYNDITQNGKEKIEVVTIHEDHHQGMISNLEDGFLLGFDPRDGNQEIIWYPDTRCLCFQAHPEWGHEGTKELFFKLISECIG